MRRSPAEYYIRFRLIADRKKNVDDIAKALAGELVFPPNKEYLVNLRREMAMPMVFRPKELTDMPSQVFIRAQGVFTMFHPTRAWNEAKQAFDDLHARSLLQSLVSGPHPDPTILDVYRMRTNLPMSEAGLKEFKHYYWNMSIVTLDELAEYVRLFLGDKTLQTMLRLPKSPDAMFVSMARLGVIAKDLEAVEGYKMFQRFFLQDATELMTLREVHPQRSAALKMSGEGFKESTQCLTDLAADRGEAVAELIEFQAATKDIEMRSLGELKKGQAPVPVGLLEPFEGEEDDEEEEVADGK